MENWGFVIKRLMKERHMNARELAENSEIDYSYLRQILSGLTKKGGVETRAGLAKGLNLTLDELEAEILGQKQKSAEQPEQILERYRLSAPISVPVYTDFPFHAGEPTDPVEYIYRARAKPAKKSVEGYIVHGNCLDPIIQENDIIILDRDLAIDEGDIIACLAEGQFYIGRLRKVADELWLENNHAHFRFKECQVAAPVIEIIRRLK